MVRRSAIVAALLLALAATPARAWWGTLCVSEISLGMGEDATSLLYLTQITYRAGWALWATTDVEARVDGGEAFTLGPQRPYRLGGGENVLTTIGQGPYLVHLCAAGDTPPGTGWQIYFPAEGL